MSVEFRQRARHKELQAETRREYNNPDVAAPHSLSMDKLQHSSNGLMVAETGLFSSWIAVGVAGGLIFGGCCSNACSPPCLFPAGMMSNL